MRSVGVADTVFGKDNQGKSSGREYRETRWLCGKVGHQAAECGGKGRRRRGVEAVEEEVVANVGAVWTIAAVEKMEDKEKVVALTSKGGGGTA